MRKRFGATIAAAALVLTACIAPGPSHERGSVEFITIAAGGTSGPYYQIGASMAQIFRNELGSDASVQATGASVENISLITSGRAELAFVMGDATRQAVEGTGPFEGRRQLSELTALTALYPNYVQIVTTARTGIRSVEDLRGKRVGVGDKNSGVELNAQMILDAYGMTYDDIQEDFLSYSGAIDQIKNGQTDAAFVTSGLPTPQSWTLRQPKTSSSSPSRVKDSPGSRRSIPSSTRARSQVEHTRRQRTSSPRRL